MALRISKPKPGRPAKKKLPHDEKTDGLRHEIALARDVRHRRAQLLDGLRELYERLGHVPSVDEIDRASAQGLCACELVYRRAFGGIYAAFRAAGLPVSSVPVRSDQQMLDDLRRLAERLGHDPAKAEVKRAHAEGQCAAPTSYVRRFGGLRVARQAAGLGLVSSAWVIRRDRERMLDDLRRLAAQLGHGPSQREIDQVASQRLCANSRTYKDHFGGLVQARKEAGLLAPAARNRRRSDQEMIDDLRRLAKALGHTPSTREAIRACKQGVCASASNYRLRFGTYSRALTEAGLTPRKRT
jgi:phage terminase small subunit